MYSKPLCPDHNIEMILRESKYRAFWICIMQPGCDYKVGAHPDGKPLGFPVDQETRSLRHELHELCDKYWPWDDPIAKKIMYRYLRDNTKRGHIAQMDKAELLELKSLLLEKFKPNKHDWTNY